jgi:hypothetical protein
MTRLGTSAIAAVVGIGFGVGIMLASERLQAQQRPDQRPLMENQAEVRLVMIPAPRGKARLEGFGPTERFVQPDPPLVFLKDTKSEGCWLASLGDRNEAVALAVAPSDACR